MVGGVLKQLSELRQADGSLDFSNRAGKDDDACIRSNSMHDLYIQCGLAGPTRLIVMWVILVFIERRNDLNFNGRETERFVEDIYILLQGRATKGIDVDDGLPFACKTVLYE